jgi:hypothetical protein
VLWYIPDSYQSASGVSNGLAVGAQKAQVKAYQLDWGHLLRPLWGQAACLEEQIYAALEAVEERSAQFEQAQIPTQTAGKASASLGSPDLRSGRKIARSDQFYQLAQPVDAQFTLINLQSGKLPDPLTGAAPLCALGEQLGGWQGRVYSKLSRNLIYWADGLFAYHPVLRQALDPLIERWGEPAIRILSIWGISKRIRSAAPGRSSNGNPNKSCGNNSSITLFRCWGGSNSPQPGRLLGQVLNRSWRGSMLVECVDILLRPVLARRKGSDRRYL